MVYDSGLQQMVLFGGFGTLDEAIWTLREAWNGPSVFVDWQNSGTQDGHYYTPFQTVHQASSAAEDCSHIDIRTGDYLEGPLTINKPVRLEAINGQVYIH